MIFTLNILSTFTVFLISLGLLNALFEIVHWGVQAHVYYTTKKAEDIPEPFDKFSFHATSVFIALYYVFQTTIDYLR